MLQLDSHLAAVRLAHQQDAGAGVGRPVEDSGSDVEVRTVVALDDVAHHGDKSGVAGVDGDGVLEGGFRVVRWFWEVEQQRQGHAAILLNRWPS
jgi:hypothetical protein